MKIEEGDVVRLVEPYGLSRAGFEFTVERVSPAESCIDTQMVYGGGIAVYSSRLSVVRRGSPIRTVTRREIVPGDYGIIEVMLDKHGQLEIGLNYTRVDANDLRSAAMILSQLAEALDDNADNA